MPASDVPILVRHMAVAIYKTGYGEGSQTQRFWHCFDAARWRCVEYGLLRNGAQVGLPSEMKLTSKGQARCVLHEREGDKRTKDDLFETLYALIETEVEKPDGGDRPPTVVGKTPQAYRAKQQAREAEAAAATPRPRRRSSKAKTVKKATKRMAKRG